MNTRETPPAPAPEPALSSVVIPLLKGFVYQESDHERQTAHLQSAAEALAALRRDHADLERQIAANGGDRIATLAYRIEAYRAEKARGTRQ